MRVVVQRVSEASVSVEGKVTGNIAGGLLVLLGITHSDTQKDAAYLVQKVLNLRVFEDQTGKMNSSLVDVSKGLLVVSQFTLYGDCRKGNRPSFVDAAKPDHAKPLYEYFLHECAKKIPDVQSGIFGAHMDVLLHNDGPVTILLDSSR